MKEDGPRMALIYIILEDPDNHMNQPYEKDATKRGQEYLNKNLK